MTVDFDILKRNELRAAARLVGRAFEDYEYFTNYFPDLEERRKVLRGVVYREYLTNFKRTHYLVAKAVSKREQSDACIDSAEREQARPEVKMNDKLVAVAQVNAPDYKKPSDFQYLIHGWPLVYLGVNRRRLDDWLAMDAAAGKPCHEYQAKGTEIWYLSSITVDPSAQGIGIGKQFIAYIEDYIRAHGGRELVLFTNSDKNIAFYKRCGFEVFDEHRAEAVFAVVDGREVGFALYFYNFSTFIGHSGLYLEDLFVWPEERGKGYGKVLLLHLVKIAREHHCGRMEWTCLNWNQPSIDFYLSLGAVPMKEWTVYRLDAAALEHLSEDYPTD